MIISSQIPHSVDFCWTAGPTIVPGSEVNVDVAHLGIYLDSDLNVMKLTSGLSIITTPAS